MFRTAMYWILNRFRGRGLANVPGVSLLIRAVRQPTAVIHGFPIELDPEDSLRLSLFGSFEPEQTALIESIVKPGDVVVDLGAHIGYYTLLFSKLVGPTGRVIAFEPSPDTCAILRRNVANNGLVNVTIENAGAGESSHSGVLHVGENRLDYHTGGEAGGNTVPIEVVALDAYFPEGATVDFVKMDIQGAEPAALRGMERLLARSPNARVLTEFWPKGILRAGGVPEELPAQLRALGFAFTKELPGTDGGVYLYCTKAATAAL
jgi:FkbM family methyltransferase